ncbi:4a-hydroxytetrahydrobiopterin dehydratase [Candidatus Spongiihabitans sp.]|uniref:4a-hydroxytetrahydrobiopterin dehydratase n=1 Tax=Candidatus Spongiihabitans sp. TaxID=3101308 RepID=UPI003C6FCDC9
MKQILLDSTQLSAQLNHLNSALENPWEVVDQKLHKTFVLKNFIQAFGFMTQCAIAAEKMNHHPQWSNVYKTVEINLTTHESGGITTLDFELAQRMEQFSGDPRDGGGRETQDAKADDPN